MTNDNPQVNTVQEDGLSNLDIDRIQNTIVSQAGKLKSHAKERSEAIELFSLNNTQLGVGILMTGIATGKRIKDYRAAKEAIRKAQREAVLEAAELINKTGNQKLIEQFRKTPAWDDLLEAEEKVKSSAVGSPARAAAESELEEAVNKCAKELHKNDFFKNPNIQKAKGILDGAEKNLVRAQNLRNLLHGTPVSGATIESVLQELKANGVAELSSVDATDLKTAQTQVIQAEKPLRAEIKNSLFGLADAEYTAINNDIARRIIDSDFETAVKGKISPPSTWPSGVTPLSVDNAYAKLQQRINTFGLKDLKQFITNDSALKHFTDIDDLVNEVTTRYTARVNAFTADTWDNILQTALNDRSFRLDKTRFNLADVNEKFLKNPDLFKSHMDDLIPFDETKVDDIINAIKERRIGGAINWTEELGRKVDRTTLSRLNRAYGSYARARAPIQQIDDIIVDLGKTATTLSKDNFGKAAQILDNLDLVGQAEKGIGRIRATKLFGNDGPRLAQLLKDGPIDSTIRNTIEKAAKKNALIRNGYEKAWKGGKWIGNAGALLGLYMAATAVEQKITDDSQINAFLEMGDKLAQDAGIPALPSKFTNKAERETLIDWALTKVPEGSEKHKLFTELKKHNCDLGQYLWEENKAIKDLFSDLESAGEIDKEYQESLQNMVKNNANALLFTELEKYYNADPANSQTIGGKGTTDTVDNDDNGDNDDKDKVEDLTDAQKKRLQELKERVAKGGKLSDAEKKEYEDLLKGRLDYLNAKKDKTPEEEKECKEIQKLWIKSRDGTKAGGQGTTPAPTETKGPGEKGPGEKGSGVKGPGVKGPGGNSSDSTSAATPPSTPVYTPGSGPTSPTPTEKKDTTSMLPPPEAVIQDPAKESWWSRNMSWILTALAVVATAGLAYFFIRKYKKKSDEAKSETSTLKTQVSDLETQISDLSKSNGDNANAGKNTQTDNSATQTSTLAQSGTQITNMQSSTASIVNAGNGNTNS